METLYDPVPLRTSMATARILSRYQRLFQNYYTIAEPEAAMVHEYVSLLGRADTEQKVVRPVV